MVEIDEAEFEIYPATNGNPEMVDIVPKFTPSKAERQLQFLYSYMQSEGEVVDGAIRTSRTEWFEVGTTVAASDFVTPKIAREIGFAMALVDGDADPLKPLREAMVEFESVADSIAEELAAIGEVVDDGE